MGTGVSHSIRLAAAVGLTLAVLAPSAQAQEIMTRGVVTGVKAATRASTQIDYANARPFNLLQAPEGLSFQAQQDMISNLINQFQTSAATDSGEVAGGEGDGSLLGSMELGPASEALVPQAGGDVGSLEHGTSNRPYSSARADLTSPTNTMGPYRATGRLFFTIPGQGEFWCSASLIKRGVVVTAAHCVAEYGQRQFYTNWRFVPGYRNGVAPYRVWTAFNVWVLTSYFTGIPASQCAVAGIVCTTDIAVIELRAQTNPTYPGTSTGWYGYGWNRFGFTSSGLTHVTQLGYPGNLDSGLLMQRNDAQGFIGGSSVSGNTLIGSRMRGGSSGGPWLLNFGIRASGTPSGTYPSPNIVIGVTSWGYVSTGPQELGASPFTSTNIVPLVNAACAGGDPRCS